MIEFCNISAHASPVVATHVVYNLFHDHPYMYLCPACAEAFQEGQEVFELPIKPVAIPEESPPAGKDNPTTIRKE